MPGSASRTTPSRRSNQDDDEDEDEDDFGVGYGGGLRRGMSAEDTSMQKIKTVQGQEGRWTVTDCDADKKGEK